VGRRCHPRGPVGCGSWPRRRSSDLLARLPRRRVAVAGAMGHVGPVQSLSGGVRHHAARRHPDRRPVPPHQAGEPQAGRVPPKSPERDRRTPGPQDRSVVSDPPALTKADERLDDKGRTKLLGLLAAGDPKGEVKDTWHAKEVIRSIYEIDDPQLADQFVTRLAGDLQDRTFPPEVRSLGRTLRRWKDHIVAWHQGRATNGPTEAVNNLIKRTKRIAFGFRSFRSFRVRALLYAGRPNWDLLATVTPR